MSATTFCSLNAVSIFFMKSMPFANDEETSTSESRSIAMASVFTVMLSGMLILRSPTTASNLRRFASSVPGGGGAFGCALIGGGGAAPGGGVDGGVGRRFGAAAVVFRSSFFSLFSQYLRSLSR